MIIRICCLLSVCILCLKCQAPKVEKSPEIEQYRPQIHFTPEVGWMSAPIGMVQEDGNYKAFYNASSDSLGIGPWQLEMAKSKDLLRWEQGSVKVKPVSNDQLIYASITKDWENISGLGKNGNAPMLSVLIHLMNKNKAIKNANSQVVNFMYSIDQGSSWEPLDGHLEIHNPDIERINAAKLLWHSNSNSWITLLTAADKIYFYSTQDLKNWEFESSITLENSSVNGNVESLEFFPLQISNSNETRWVLLFSQRVGSSNGDSGTLYSIGNFDGHHFSIIPNSYSKENFLRLDFGSDHSGGLIYSNNNDQNKSVIYQGWMSNWQYARELPTDKWHNALTLSREMKLINQKHGFRLITTAFTNIASLGASTTNLDRQQLSENILLNNTVNEIEFVVEKPVGGLFGIKLSNENDESITIGFNATRDAYFIDRNQSGNTSFHKIFKGVDFATVYYDEGILKMHIFLDHSSVELFADDGKIAMTTLAFPSTPYTMMELVGNLHQGSIISMKTHGLTPSK